MNSRVLELAKQAGFVFWEDEPHKPENATIDWSANYDEELVRFYELVMNEAFYYGDCDDNMDGDHDSALSSAGWGTDEDYRA